MMKQVKGSNVGDISVIVCVYTGDDAAELKTALKSVSNQTRPPDEILIVEDGPLTPALNKVLEHIQSTVEIPINRVKHAKNRGHGAARRTGIKNASHDLVAIQDADDIAVPKRLEWSLEKLKTADADLVGGYIEEFNVDPDEPYAVREVPCDAEKIREMAKYRSPVNHTTVLADREAILEAGSYRTVGQMEDYELWARMLVNGCKFVNIPRVLAKVRAGKKLYRRRGGLEHILEECRLQRHFATIGFISSPRAVLNFVVRSIPKLLPNKLREYLYTTLFRESGKTR